MKGRQSISNAPNLDKQTRKELETTITEWLDRMVRHHGFSYTFAKAYLHVITTEMARKRKKELGLYE